MIAEKLLAIEAGEKNELIQNENFQLYIQGRKEQAMRQWFIQKELYEQVKLDPQEIEKRYRIAGRKYKIQYFTMENPAIADTITNKLSQPGKSYEDVYYEMTGLDSIPEREVEWKSQESTEIHRALFSDTLTVNQVIGPIKTEDGIYVFMKIKGWTDEVVMTEKAVEQRLQDVKDRLTQEKAIVLYENYVRRLMRGKTLNFSPEMFEKAVFAFAPLYFRSKQENKELFLHNLLDKQIESKDDSVFTDLERFYEIYGDRPFLQIDDQTWTISDFERELELHPLVFRKPRMSQREFAEQFRLAVADMVRDKYITKQAYKKGYDKVNVVERNVQMWRDASLAVYQKYRYLSQQDTQGKGGMEVITNILNPYIDELQQKYSDRIEIDVDLFNNTKLTRIDMFVLQKNMPYPIVVPSFPQLTTDHWLDYGNRMVND